MTPQIKFLEEARKRVEELRAKAKLGVLRGQTAVGQGKIVDKVKERVDQFLHRIGERKPNLIQKATKTIETWKPGEKVKLFIPTTPTTTPSPPSVPSIPTYPEEKYKFRD